MRDKTAFKDLEAAIETLADFYDIPEGKLADLIAKVVDEYEN